jgi:predicted nucleic acid-binding protein
LTYLFDTNHAIAYLNGDPRLTLHLTAAQTAGDTFAISRLTVLTNDAHFSQIDGVKVAIGSCETSARPKGHEREAD